MAEKQWGVYILECGDGSLYTGCTNNLGHRLDAHRSGKGAKYTRGRGPLKLRYWVCCDDCSDALRKEIEIKALSREDKLSLCRTYRGK